MVRGKQMNQSAEQIDQLKPKYTNIDDSTFKPKSNWEFNI